MQEPIGIDRALPPAIEPLPLAPRATAMIRPTVAKHKEQGEVAAEIVAEMLLQPRRRRPPGRPSPKLDATLAEMCKVADVTHETLDGVPSQESSPTAP